MATAGNVLDRSLLYERVRETLRERCRREAGETLPSLRQLSLELNVNHFTISRALRDLEDEGIVKILPRKGIFIQSQTPPAPTRKSVELITFNSGLRNISLCLLRGIEETAGNGIVHNTMLVNTPLPDVHTFVQTLKARQVDAVLFNGVSYVGYPESLEEANFIHQVAQHLPIAIVGSPHQIVEADCVYGDTRPAMQQYLEMCRKKGLERYAYLGATQYRPANRERFECFKDFILEHRLPWNKAWIVEGGVNSRREEIRALFEQPVKPQVLLAYNVNYAYAAIMEAQQRGLQPGRDIHILAFASIAGDAETLQPDATVVFIDEEEVGRRAYELLQEKASTPHAEREPQIVRIPARFLNNRLEQ